MVINSSGLTQIYYWHTTSVTIPPNFLFDPKFGVNGMREVKNVLKEIEKAETIILQRTFGLGDVLMLLPVVKELKQLYPSKKIILATVEVEFREAMTDILDEGWLDGVIDTTRVEGGKYDIGAYFDWYLERDHATPGYMKHHRVDLYRKFLGLPIGKKPEWSKESERGRGKYVLLHEGGNRDVKSLPKETFNYLINQLGKVYPIKSLGRETRLSAIELVELVMDAMCIVTMDSAPLWIAHFTRTPTVAILGPTRPEERITYHPLYPEGATAIKLNELINCSPCREGMGKCHGKATCLQVPKEEVAVLVENAIEEVRWKD